MKISPIRYNPYSNFINYKKQNKLHNSPLINQNKELPVKNDLMLAFCGGQSLNLAQTKKQIDKFGKYPDGIKELIEKELENSNPENKTLIDIHKEKYKKLLEFETLDDIKKAYPEFRDVLSDSEIEYQENSFIGDVKRGEIEYFDPDIDLSVQLIQLYYGEGFSLTDLKNQFAGKNIYRAFEKLNIPRLNRLYGNYLKLSDKNYNERFTKSLSEKLKEVKASKIERQEGVYIPKGPLSEEHKAKISNGLKKFYTEHPDRLSDMSKRQIEYFMNNPEEREKFSQVLLRAWDYKEADSVKRALSKFMGAKNLNNDELARICVGENKKLKDFWNKNPWAKDKFSHCMKKSWQRQSELGEMDAIYEPVYYLQWLPDEIKHKVAEQHKNVISASNLNRTMTTAMLDPRDIERTGALTRQTNTMKQAVRCAVDYLNANENVASSVIDATLLAFFMGFEEFEKIATERNSKEDLEAYKLYTTYFLHKLKDEINAGDGVLYGASAQKLYFDMSKQMMSLGDLECLHCIDKSMNRAYKILKKSDNKTKSNILIKRLLIGKK